jgi:hypothetical protein
LLLPRAFARGQAIGRVIRHVNDWGAIILLDQRFADAVSGDGMEIVPTLVLMLIPPPTLPPLLLLLLPLLLLPQ